MKRTILSKIISVAGVAGVLSGATVTCRADYATQLLGMQPITYWRFNDNVTTPVYDVATNLGSLGPAANGRYNDSYTRPVPGAIAGDTAVAFSNPSLGTAYFGSMLVPNNPALNPAGPFTIEFWAKPSNATAALLSPVNSMSFNPGRAGYLFYQNGATWQFRVGVSSSTTASVLNGGVVVSNEWQHVVGVYSGGASGTMTLFVNGVQVGSGSGSYEVNAVAPFSVGSTTLPNRTFDGAVDEVAFYSAALSAGQIAAHYDARTTNAAGYATQIQGDAPVGYWRLNEPQDTLPVAANLGSLAAAENAKYVGVTNTAGPSGPSFPGFEANNSAASFDGTESYVRAPSPGLSGPLSVVAWVNPNSLNGDRAIAGENTSWTFKLLNSQLRFTTPGIKDHDSTTASIATNVWQQVAITFNPGAAGGAQFYQDGQPVGSVDASRINKGAAPFWIGKNQFAGQILDGAIDEVAVFDKILASGQILSLYFTAIGSNAPPFMVSDPPVVSPAGTIYTTTPFSIIGDVAGALPLFYQWRLAGANLPGATNLTYSVTSAKVGDSGNYDLVITNAFGAVTSSIVTITVNPAAPPTITQQPASRPVYPNGNASFLVQADGTPPLTFQWKKNGVNIVGQTNQVLIITNASSADAASYAVGVTNVAGGALSASATLTLRTPTAGTYEAAVVASGPLAYWRFGERSGTTAFDYAGGHDGIYTNVTLGQPGYSSTDPDTSAGFEQAQLSSVGVPDFPQFNYVGSTPTFSLEAWVNFSDLSRIERVFSKGGVGFNGIGFGADQAGTLRFTTYGVQDFDQALPTPMTTNTWYHLAGVANGGTFYFYLNGEPVGSIAFSGAAIAAQGNPPFAIGRNGLGTADETVTGLIDEPAVYGRALTAQEIKTHYSIGRYGTTTPPLIVWGPVSQDVAVGFPVFFTVPAVGSIPLGYQWNKGGTPIPGATGSVFTINSVTFGDAGAYSVTITNAAGSTNRAATLAVFGTPSYAQITNDLVVHLKLDTDFTDSSGRANDAFAFGAAPALVPGKLGQAVQIKCDTTTSTYHALQFFSAASDLQFGDVDSFSVSLWLKYTTAFNDLPIIGNAHNSTYNPGWIMTEDGGRFEWTAEGTGTGGASITADPVGGPLINDGNWHQLAVVFDRTNLVANSYVDGALVDSRSIAGLGSVDTGLPTTIGQDDSGNYPTHFGSTLNTTFDLDDLGIWRRALSYYEVTSIYNAAQGGQSFDKYGPIKLSIGAAGTNAVIGWQAGTLESNTDLKNVTGWAPVPNAQAPLHTVTPGTGSVFYRVRQ